jgi:NAD(P)-dependent dehydrogenase (short-subunit alcohol dehydrogenase family)
MVAHYSAVPRVTIVVAAMDSMIGPSSCWTRGKTSSRTTTDTRCRACSRHVILASQPNKRFVDLEELAQVVLFLCSEAAASITGAALPVDGGWTAR